MSAGKASFVLGPGKMCQLPKKPWWNSECSRAVAVKRRAYARWRRQPIRAFQLEYRRLEAKDKKILKKFKKLSFREFLKKLNFNTTSTVA